MVVTIEQIAQGKILNFFIYLIIRVISAVICVYIAKNLNRNQNFWGIFGFILPPISLIIIPLLHKNEVKRS